MSKSTHSRNMVEHADTDLFKRFSMVWVQAPPEVESSGTTQRPIFRQHRRLAKGNRTVSTISIYSLWWYVPSRVGDGLQWSLTRTCITNWAFLSRLEFWLISLYLQVYLWHLCSARWACFLITFHFEDAFHIYKHMSDHSWWTTFFPEINFDGVNMDADFKILLQRCAEHIHLSCSYRIERLVWYLK